MVWRQVRSAEDSSLSEPASSALLLLLLPSIVDAQADAPKLLVPAQLVQATDEEVSELSLSREMWRVSGLPWCISQSLSERRCCLLGGCRTV